MTAHAIKPVTKTVLSGFVRENSGLSLTQAKALTDQLLAEYIVTVKPPTDPSTVPVEPGQLWLHEASQRTLRVIGVDSGPIHVPGDSVTSWGPQSVSWKDTKTPGEDGVVPIQLWRLHMVPMSGVDETMSTSHKTPTPSPITPSESEIAP